MDGQLTAAGHQPGSEGPLCPRAGPAWPLLSLVDACLSWPFPMRNAFTMPLGSLRLGSAVPAFGGGCHQLAPISLLQLSPRTGKTELPLRSHSAAHAAIVPPAAFSLPATTATHLPFFHPRTCFWDLWFALSLHWYPKMQVRQVNITNLRNTLNWERQEMCSRNRSESKTNCHTDSESAVNLTALLCVPGVTSFPSCEQCSLTCLVPERGITWASIQKLFLWGKCSFIVHWAILLPCHGVHSTGIGKIIQEDFYKNVDYWQVYMSEQSCLFWACKEQSKFATNNKNWNMTEMRTKYKDCVCLQYI